MKAKEARRLTEESSVKREFDQYEEALRLIKKRAKDGIYFTEMEGALLPEVSRTLTEDGYKISIINVANASGGPVNKMSRISWENN